MTYAVLILATIAAAASDVDEFRVKREGPFEFARPPVVTRRGDRVTITFETKAFCDVTIAIEESSAKVPGTGGFQEPSEQPRILRHLASGVLGPNAPEPFEKNSKKQTIVWDGKNDKGEYLDDKDRLTVRVSLGLKPRFERTLGWSPYRRVTWSSGEPVVFQAAPEGVYVLDGGNAIDSLRLFDHDGNYRRTVYPFPADKIDQVKGLYLHTFPQDGQTLPIKPNFLQSTLLTAGTNSAGICYVDGRYKTVESRPRHFGQFGRASDGMAIANGHIALASLRLNRLATDGTSGGLSVYGPRVDLRKDKGFYKATASYLAMTRGGYSALTNLPPHRLALSPDARTLYLTRYTETYALDSHVHSYWQHGVYRMDFPGEKEPTLFAGGPGPGSDDTHFNMPADVACDGKGRVYVADYGNNRIQVFTPGGKLVRSIPVKAPAQLAIHPETGAFYVFSWRVLGRFENPRTAPKRPFLLHVFKSVDDPTLVKTYTLPMHRTVTGEECYAEVDFWAKPLTIWAGPLRAPKRIGRWDYAPTGAGLLREKDGGLRIVRDFEKEATRAVLRSRATEDHRERLYFDPKHETLYVGDGKCFRDAVAIDPNTGRMRFVPLPFDIEDMCFDIDGRAYLRTPTVVARYDPETWREVPFDYGSPREKVTYNPHSGRREAYVASAILLPVNSGWHQGGMHVSPRGRLVIGCLYWYKPKREQFTRGGQEPFGGVREYEPTLYPGRLANAAYGCEFIHVWDDRGKALYQDAIPGLGILNGVAIDNRDNLYVLSAAPRILDGQPHFNDMAGTLMKFRPGDGKVLTVGKNVPIPAQEKDIKERDPDLYHHPGQAWVNGADWFFGGVGWGGKNRGNGCACWNCRFALDYFGRSFAPEMDRYSVAVLDTNGNVILRVGRYGNVDDGIPLGSVPFSASEKGTDPVVPERGTGTSPRLGASPRFRSIGGDEVAFFYAPYVATHSDRRLFIADPGNGRIVGVRLDYHATQRIHLKDVNDSG